MDRVFLNADRLNGEPPIFRGCSSSELVALAVLAFVTWVPLGLVLGFLVGAPTLGVGFSGIAIIGSVFVSTTVLQKLKRGRPDHPGRRNRRTRCPRRTCTPSPTTSGSN